MMIAIQRRTALACSFAALLSLAACGGGGSDGTPPDTSGSSNVTVLVKTDTVVGTGPTAVNGKTITVHYTGWLYDVNAVNKKGLKFDSSVDRGQPFTYVLGAGTVIAGWEQGIPEMKVGGKRTLTIPASLAYGAAGRAPSIPPNAALVFDVELVAVN